MVEVYNEAVPGPGKDTVATEDVATDMKLVVVFEVGSGLGLFAAEKQRYIVVADMAEYMVVDDMNLLVGL